MFSAMHPDVMQITDVRAFIRHPLRKFNEVLTLQPENRSGTCRMTGTAGRPVMVIGRWIFIP
jgi:hypothetical protein